MADVVHEILRERNRHIALSPDVRLGADGVGLDSIALVEVLFACEKALGVEITADALAAPALTVGYLIETLQSRVRE